MKRLNIKFFDTDPRYPLNIPFTHQSISKLSNEEIAKIERPKTPLPIQRVNNMKKIIEETQNVKVEELPPFENTHREVVEENKPDLSFLTPYNKIVW